MNTAAEQSVFADYKVADIHLAIGADELEIAESEMPALIALREHYPTLRAPRFWVAST